MSKEEVEYYIRFFEAFKILCHTFNINCSAMFMMQDACQSEAAAIEYSYPNTTTLMCYFHVTKNVKERLRGNKKKAIPATDEKFHSIIMRDITCMHYSRSLDEFNIYQTKIFNEWSQHPEMKNFQDYFVNHQWVMNKRTNKWQIFHTPPGYASTNNPTEASLNKEIKGTYANYECVSMLGCVNLIYKIIYDLSLSQKEVFDIRLARNNNIAKEALDLDKNNFFFYGTNDCYYKWDPNLNQYKHFITFSPMFCSCSWFLDVGNCRHYVAACKLSNRELTDEDREFVCVKGRGRPKKVDLQRRF